MNDKELARCRARLVQYLEDLLAPLGRRDRRHWGEVYIRGLLLEGERKSIEPLAQRLPEGNVQALQQLVGQSPWPEAPVRAHLARRLAQELTPGAAWVVDEVGFPKQGKHSVGVARQYCGTLGKVGNCQVAVSLNHTTDDGSFPVDWRLYLPESWIRDPARCAAAGVPDGTPFQTKWELALACCDQARARGVPDGVVLADAAYGSVTAFREGLEARRLRYVVDGDSTLTAWPTPQTRHPVPYPGRGRRPKPQYLGPPPQALAALAAGLPGRRGARSAGGRAPSRGWRAASPPSACSRRRAPARGRRSSRWRGCSSRGPPARRPRRSTGCRTSRPTPPCAGSCGGRRAAGASSGTTGSSSASWGWTTTRAVAGGAGITR